MYKYLLGILVLIFVAEQAYAQEQIYTTLDGTADKIIFDGKYTIVTEWKPTSFDDIRFDDQRFVIRTGHDYENLYVMVNYVSDTSIERNSDKVVICFDGNMEKSDKPDNNDYCFLSTIGSSNPITLQGGNKIPNKNFFKVVSNHPELLGVGEKSDENDRYSKIPHSTYEYKIPLEIFGKSHVYGFYVGVYDDKMKTWHTWPKNIPVEKYPFIPSPNSWGELVSPDKSIPEFEYVLLAVLPAFVIMVVVSRVKFGKISNFY